jgi:hypothetical protein
VTWLNENAAWLVAVWCMAALLFNVCRRKVEARRAARGRVQAWAHRYESRERQQLEALAEGARNGMGV